MATRRGPDGTARVSISGTHNGTNWANVFWFILTGGLGASQANLDAWTTAIQNAYKTYFQPGTPTTVAYVAAHATLFQSGGTVLQSQIPMTGAGTNGGAEIDDNAASVCVSWVTSVYWRGGKPRTYFPGILQSQVTQGRVIDATSASGWKTNADNFHNACNTATSGAITATQHGFVSFRSGNADRATPLFFAVSGSLVHHRLATQRRRLGKWAI